MKHGYFKGNCVKIGIEYKNVFYDFPVFDEQLKIVDNAIGVEIKDYDTKFAFFTKKVMEGKYLDIEEELIEEIIKKFPQERIQFIEKEEKNDGC